LKTSLRSGLFLRDDAKFISFISIDFLNILDLNSMQNLEEFVTINSRKYDGKIHKTWKAELIAQKANLLTFIGEFEKEIVHPHLGIIRRGTVSREFYWLDGWFNVFRFHEPDGRLRNFYCNINIPPKFEDNILDYVDLDIDVLVWKDFSIEVLDTEEFEENCRKFDYPAEIKSKVEESLQKLIELVENREFPFDTGI